jgi:hypothetical protein
MSEISVALNSILMPHQAADLAGLPETELWRLVRAGRFPLHHLINRGAPAPAAVLAARAGRGVGDQQSRGTRRPATPAAAATDQLSAYVVGKIHQFRKYARDHGKSKNWIIAPSGRLLRRMARKAAGPSGHRPTGHSLDEIAEAWKDEPNFRRTRSYVGFGKPREP